MTARASRCAPCVPPPRPASPPRGCTPVPTPGAGACMEQPDRLPVATSPSSPASTTSITRRSSPSTPTSTRSSAWRATYAIPRRPHGRHGHAELNRRVVAADLDEPSTGDGGTCYGDSGGPNFLGTTDVIAATTITGDAVCRSTNVDYRLDTESARAFLSQYVKLP